jgi:DNA-binding transcriptional ArsR family regulator
MATAVILCEDQTLAQVCKALGCVVRIQILRYVLEHPGCIGNEILLHLPDGSPRAQSTLSQHLRVLRNAGLLEAFEEGSAVCYRVNQAQLAWINQALEHLSVGAFER